MNRKISYALMACVAACITLPSSADATAYSFSTFGFYGSSSGALDSTYDNASNYGGAGVTSAVSGTTTTNTPTGSLVTYSGTATAGYGILKAAGSSSNSVTGVTLSNTSNTDYSSAGGQATFADVWTITGGTGQGTLELTFNLDGYYGTCDTMAGYQAGLGALNISAGYQSFSSTGGPNFGLGDAGCTGGSPNTYYSGTQILSTPFTFGTPLDFSVTMTMMSNIYNDTTGLTPGTIGGLSRNDLGSIINFSDTATLSSLIVQDSTGVITPTITSPNAGLYNVQLGLTLPAPTTSVPEPPTLALFGAGLGLLGFAAMRRRKNRAA